LPCIKASFMNNDNIRKNIISRRRISNWNTKNLLFIKTNKEKQLLLTTTTTNLNLIPLADLAPSIFTSESYRSSSINEQGHYTTKNNEQENPYVICLAEEDDLTDIATLTIEAFGTEAVTLGKELNEFERQFLNPAVGFWNNYTNAVAFVEVLYGLRARTSQRFTQQIHGISKPDIQHSSLSHKDIFNTAAKSSIVLVLARPSHSNDGSIDCIATVELRLQPTDAKIPFSQPWLDRIERNIAKSLSIHTLVQQSKQKKLQPYLSNLCVSQNYRKKRIGNALVKCLEYISKEIWGFQKIYLHVDLDNEPAVHLYRKQHYFDVGLRWNPFWAGKSAEIGYFVKEL